VPLTLGFIPLPSRAGQQSPTWFRCFTGRENPWIL